MKVTVCFGNTKVVVPCGNGDLLVGELIEKATIRYRKAIGKPSDYWVSVQSLKSSSDGGILDADDQLKDVADDREQILALYDEQDAPPVPHNGGDGTSASSVGTSSPDIFQGGEYNNNKDYHDYLRQTRKNDVIITQNDLNSHHSGSSLIVRRGSEPSLTKIIDNGPDRRPDFLPQNSDNKRWSAIASLDEAKSPRASEADDEHGYDTPPPTLERVGGIGQELDGQNSHNSSFSNFSRGSSRRSLANNAAMIKWLEAQEKAQDKFDSEFQPGRREPLGGRAEDEVKLNGVTKLSLLSPSKQGELIVIPNSTGPLGIHVVPELENGREKGLLIQSIDAGGRIYRDGRMHPADVIVEINGTNLTGVDFAKAQEVFRQALTAPDLRLRILRAPPPLPSHPPPVARPLTTPPSSPTSNSNGSLPSRTPPSTPSKQNNNDPTTSPPPSPTRGPPPPIPARNPTTALTSTSARITVSNTRKIGKKIHIQLTKGAAGLGFSVTTRDNPAGGHAPIYIKNILPKGAAIEDGRLKPGDRLLEVNGIEMTGKSQTEAVTVLRNTKINGVVNLVVSRQVLENEEDNDETTVSDSSSVQKRHSSSSSNRERPASTLGFLPSQPEPGSRLSVSKSNQDLLDGGSPRWQKQSTELGDDEKSPTEEIDPNLVFSREGFGRQSMSEKRKGHMDPRVSEFYQKIKSNKDSTTGQFLSGSRNDNKSLKRVASAESLLGHTNRLSLHDPQTEELGPMLGLKKSSSLESLQRAVQDEEELSDTSSVQRNRGINESFRAAVDRSYEGQQAETMETVEEEGSETGSVIQTAGSRAPSFSRPEPDKDKKHKSKKEKEKGIFKGLFKFGKAKKDEKSAKVATEDSKPLKQSDRQRAPSTDQLTDTQEENRLREYQKKQQEKLRLLEQQRDIENQARQQRDQGFLRPTSPPPRASNRAEKIQLLRHEHQKRHQERQGHYPQEDREELHERQIQEYEAQKTVLRSGNDTSVYGVYPVPPRRRYDDSMSYERARPAYVDPDHYGHYQNLQEIQAQLRQQEYYQQRYHQQTPSNYSSHSSLHTPSTYSSHSNTGHHYAREVKIPPRDPRDLRNYSHHMGYAPHYHPDPHYPPQGYYTPHHHPAYRSVTPSPHPHAPTPHSAYTTKSNPQIVVNPPPQDYSHPRSYSDYDDHQRSVYHPEPHYGSLPRRREHRETTMVPGSAQV